MLTTVLGKALNEYDPLLHNYLEFLMKTHTTNLLPTELPMHSINMPYYHSPRFQATAALTNATNVFHAQTILTNIVVHHDFGYTHLSHMPVHSRQPTDNSSVPKSGARALLNSKFAQYATHANSFN
jgi:hypothetical protein